jgi:hypothetical protein
MCLNLVKVCGWIAMSEPKVYMAYHKVRLFGLSLADRWVVMTGRLVYML